MYACWARFQAAGPTLHVSGVLLVQNVGTGLWEWVPNRRLVRAETGLGLGGLAAQVRLQRAQKLLREHALVRDAAAEAGFFDQNYFARWFKKQTGQTPVEWKASRSVR